MLCIFSKHNVLLLRSWDHHVRDKRGFYSYLCVFIRFGVVRCRAKWERNTFAGVTFIALSPQHSELPASQKFRSISGNGVDDADGGRSDGDNNERKRKKMCIPLTHEPNNKH